MSRLRRLLLVRHGETDGESSVRYHGSTDVDLSESGRVQMKRAAVLVRHEQVDLVIASPLKRSWQAAWIVGDGAQVRLVNDFREIHFGRWEGLTAEEIEARDPIRFKDWQSGAEGFEYPGGESIAAFRSRVLGGLHRLLEADAATALLVVHKGVIRRIVEALTKENLPRNEPELGGLIDLTRGGDGSWFQGRHSSDPVGLGEEGS